MEVAWMKASTRLVAAGVALGLRHSAYALPPSAWTDPDNPITVFYAGGDADQVQAVYAAVTLYLNPQYSQIDVYTDGSRSDYYTGIYSQSVSYLIVSGYGYNAGAL